jgi:mannose-6-phosphate isomerase-like protein (cupin superfamily)
VIPGPGSLSWSPVRLTLDIRAFGCNAYTASEAGQDVVEPHTEESDDPHGGHQELYYVATGRATFTIDGEQHDAPAGTYVFLPDPASHRHAVAVEAPTTVLSFGGPPTFEPSAWEWAFQAGPLIQSDPDRAREILEDGLRHHPNDGSMHYNLSCLEAVQGRREEALAELRQAIELRPESAQWAHDDADFVSLREDPEFRRLVGS